MRKVGLIIMCLAFGAALVGGWVFVHPTMPPLRAQLTGTMEPIDDRTGVYGAANDERWLIIPGLDGGFYKMRLDVWDKTYLVSSEKLDSHLAEEKLTRLAGQPYTISNVSTRNDVPLAGWMFEPAEPNGAGMVIIHGAGNSDRANSWYAILAHTMAAKGYTVIYPDKRGSGRSGGDWREEPLTTLSADGAAWLDLLREQKPMISRFGLLGVSQGGMIAPETARLGKADFAIALSATSTTLDEQIPLEVRNDIVKADAPKQLIPLLSYVYTMRAKGRFPKFWRANGGYEMMQEWGLWRGPLFIAMGEEDEHLFIPVKASVKILEADYANQPNVEWRVYDSVQHSLMYDSGPDKAHFHKDFLPDLFNWLNKLADAQP